MQRLRTASKMGRGLSERSEFRSPVRRVEIPSASKRATSSLFGCFFSGGTEKKNIKVQREAIKGYEEKKLKGQYTYAQA